MKGIIDFDDVLFPTVQSVLKLYGEKTNHKVSFSKITDWQIASICNQYNGDILELFTEIDFLKIKPFWGTAAALKKLNDNHDILIVTASSIANSKVVTNKLAAIKKYFPFIKEEQFVCTSLKYFMNPDFVIEDSPKMTNKFAMKTNSKIILINKPWNQECTSFHYRTNRLANTPKIVEKIASIK